MMMATSMQKHAVKHNKKSPPDAGFFLSIFSSFASKRLNRAEFHRKQYRSIHNRERDRGMNRRSAGARNHRLYAGAAQQLLKI